jgi:hypothetical protein
MSAATRDGRNFYFGPGSTNITLVNNLVHVNYFVGLFNSCQTEFVANLVVNTIYVGVQSRFSERQCRVDFVRNVDLMWSVRCCGTLDNVRRSFSIGRTDAAVGPDTYAWENVYVARGRPAMLGASNDTEATRRLSLDEQYNVSWSAVTGDHTGGVYNTYIQDRRYQLRSPTQFPNVPCEYFCVLCVSGVADM